MNVRIDPERLMNLLRVR